MTLANLLGALVAPYHFPGGALLPLDVVFDTGRVGMHDLTVLSVYYSDGKIHVDIGDDEDA
jgi:hypothetical protein